MILKFYHFWKSRALCSLRSHIFRGVSTPNKTVKHQYDYIIGIFSNVKNRRNLLIEAEKRNVLAIRFNWRVSIDPENKIVKNAWLFNTKTEKWEPVDEAPLPQVIFDYSFYSQYRNRNIRNRAKEIRIELDAAKIPFINPNTRIKEVRSKFHFSQLMKQKNIPHPTTMKCGRSNLNKMVKKADLVFLKPTNGHKGDGIIVIKKTEKGCLFKYTFRNSNKNWEVVIEEISDIDKIYDKFLQILNKMNRSKESYLVQEGVDIFLYKGKEHYVRSMVQRGENGELFNTVHAPRIGGKTCMGGHTDDVQLLANEIAIQTGKTASEIIQSLDDLAMKTHLAIEEISNYKIGELGMDIVFNSEGKPIVLEANEKSSTVFFKKRADYDRNDLFENPSFKKKALEFEFEREGKIIEYGRYLASCEVHKR